ncbi:hypothetical protein ACSQ76_22015 [Roseovarius sp. B08]|uniref:hypothetical protein n=1 Tax=Roseovarius sp. B08 TaxID=3449223 RepID=UPI003EDBE505
MINQLPVTFENIEGIAAEAFADARICATALREDVVPNLARMERKAPERLIKAIETGQIFDDETLVELDVLINKLSRRIADGTTQVERVDDHPYCFSEDPSWTETHRTCVAEDMSRALTVLLSFHASLQAVHDLMNAQRELEKMRQRTQP